MKNLICKILSWVFPYHPSNVALRANPMHTFNKELTWESAKIQESKAHYGSHIPWGYEERR